MERNLTLKEVVEITFKNLKEIVYEDMTTAEKNIWEAVIDTYGLDLKGNAK